MDLKRYNPLVLILPILIFLLGIITLLSITPERASSQLVYFLVGLVLYFALSKLDYTVYRYYWKSFYAFVLVLLLLTFFLGQARFGSARWLGTSSFALQPSEFAKITVVIALSALISDKAGFLKTPINIFKLLLAITPIAGLVFIQPDLGTSIVIFAIFVGIVFYAGINKIYFLFMFIFFGVFSSPAWNILQDYQQRRILVFLNPTLDVLGSGYNVIQSVIAVGSGGMLGRGFGRGTQSHLQFLPAYWTDFIFASYAEEWGFFGVLGLLLLFAALLITIIYVASKTKDAFGSLLCIGVFVVFFLQFVINIGMNLGIMPVTGIPLPLVSYGGSSLITTMMLLGLVQSVWIHRRT